MLTDVRPLKCKFLSAVDVINAMQIKGRPSQRHNLGWNVERVLQQLKLDDVIQIKACGQCCFKHNSISDQNLTHATWKGSNFTTSLEFEEKKKSQQKRAFADQPRTFL